MLRADPAQVRALVSAHHGREVTKRALALRAAPDWSGPELLDLGNGAAARVVACPSPLAVREALVDHDRRDGELLVVLTPCEGADLGLDVQARLIKRDVVPPDPFLSVCALFGVTVIDPLLAGERWLVDDLIALAPPGGFVDRRPLSGVLDIDVAWRTWHEYRLRLATEPRGVADVLALAARADVARALAELAPERRAAVATRWAGEAHSPVPVMVDVLAAGRGADLCPLGVVAQVLWAPVEGASAREQQSAARARLEQLLGRDRLSAGAANAWADSALAALERSANAAPVLDAADQILATEAAAPELAALSDALPRGFDARLAVLGRALTGRDLQLALDALNAVRRHRYGRRDPQRQRVENAEAAVRLLRRSTLPLRPTPTTFAAAVAEYAADGAWVDEARRLLVDGDHVAEVVAAYNSIGEQATTEQEGRSHRFARFLADWSASEPLPNRAAVPVERLLDDVVAPIARQAPVLLVVCDGLALPVAHVLCRDLLIHAWGPAGPVDAAPWPVGVAALPTVTAASRTSQRRAARRRRASRRARRVHQPPGAARRVLGLAPTRALPQGRPRRPNRRRPSGRPPERRRRT
jgi:hypothetical protein